MKGFKKFLMRGNVIDLAVAVVIGAAFGAVVTAMVKDLITPIIAAIVGKPDFSAIYFTVNGSKFADWRFHQRGLRIYFCCGGRLLLRRVAGEYPAGSSCKRSSPTRSDNEELYGMSQHDTDWRSPLRVLYVGRKLIPDVTKSRYRHASAARSVAVHDAGVGGARGKLLPESPISLGRSFELHVDPGLMGGAFGDL